MATLAIASRRNPTFTEVQKLFTSARALRAAGQCVLEGEHLISQYVAHFGAVDTLICAAGMTPQFPSARTLEIPVALFGALSDLASPPQMIALARLPIISEIPAAQNEKNFSVLALDDVQDPGNVGAILRTAAAVGIDEIWASANTAYPWSQKVLRASQGAQFGVRIRDGVDVVALIGTTTSEIVVTTLEQSISLYAHQFGAGSIVFVVGNEGAGVSPEILARATTRLRIPMRAPVESLNVGAATAVVLYEWARQCKAL